MSNYAVVKNLPANAGDTRDAGSIPGLGRSPGAGNGNPLQCYCLENSMGRGAHTKHIIKYIISICDHYEKLLTCLTSFFFSLLKSLNSGVSKTEHISLHLAMFHMRVATRCRGESTALGLGLLQTLVTHAFDNAWHIMNGQ